MRTLPFLWLCLALFLRSEIGSAAQNATLDLAGEWRFALDQKDAGRSEAWFSRSLSDRIQLPGVMQAQGYGDEISTNTLWVLSLYDRFWYQRADYLPYTKPGNVKVPFICQPPRHYLGAAWYQREIVIPQDWEGRRIELFLERPHWETTVWLDERRLGSCDSLVAPHSYELGPAVPGTHRVTIRVDNRMVLPYRPDAHSVSDSLGGSWNGIVGQIELRATSPVWIEEARVFPNLEKKSVSIRVRIGNSSGKPGSGILGAAPGGAGILAGELRAASASVTWTTNGGTAEIEVPLGETAQTWDEFHPVLQHIALKLEGDQAEDTRELSFGLREFRTDGQDFIINGRKTYLRGTHNGGDFPLTGAPPTDIAYWRNLFRICREWGLNHMRFHSFCPPEAAFTAADEAGFYLQPECGMWNEISPGTPMERMLYEETERMINAYGNHPSFVLLSPSNEPKGRWKDSLPKWVKHFRGEDNRRLYTTGTGWSLIDAPGPVEGADYLATAHVGDGRVRGNPGWFGRDYGASLRGVNVPVVAHELGQWCAYPDFSVIRKFTGYLRPGNYEIFRDSLAAHGLADKDKDFAWASGRFQLECYKEEIEANFRTRGLSGFQLLDLHDYMGQGTALVGLLDPFWESKGYASPDEFRGFCNATVPLAHLKSRVFTTADPFEVPVEIAHFGLAPLTNAVLTWKITDSAGKVAASGKWPSATIPLGKGFALSPITADLSHFAAPQAYALTVGNASMAAGRDVGAPSIENHWTFWLYPARTNLSTPAGILITASWPEAQSRLAAAGKVLFLPKPADLDWSCPPLDTVPIFWNRLMNPGWGRMLGIWCDTNHPALGRFPTEPNCDWQWTELLRRTRAINLGRLPRQLQPVVQPIDDWNRNYKLGLVFECKVGPGRLMVCAADISSALAQRPVARQLRESLLDYMAGPRFQPRVKVPAADLCSFLFDTRIMRKLGARAEADGADAAAILDGDPNTAWTSNPRGSRNVGRKHPHEIVITFPAAVTMNGLVLMNRQNDRDHLGDIRSYTLETSDDGAQWREISRGELPSTWDPQTITFPTPVTAKQLKLTALSGFGTDSSAALAELAILYAGPKLAENGAGNMDYQRVRSTSSDVDEGTQKPPPQ